MTKLKYNFSRRHREALRSGLLWRKIVASAIRFTFVRATQWAMTYLLYLFLIGYIIQLFDNLIILFMSIQSSVVPMVIDQSGRGERAYDIYSLLLKERIIFLGTAINDQIANVIVAQLLYLNSQDSTRQIDMYIQSPGGSVYAGMAIYDAMQMISAPVSTVAMGFSGSMGTALLTCGAKGRRYALAQATIHMHPTGGGAKGYTEDVRIATREQERLQTQLFHIMGKNTNHTWKEIEEFFRRDRFLNALEAQEYGLVDEVLGDTSNLIRLKDNDPEVEFLDT